MTRSAAEIVHDRAEYDAGYDEGAAAWREADEDLRDDDPPAHLTEGFGDRRRDGFLDGWFDEMMGIGS